MRAWYPRPLMPTVPAGTPMALKFIGKQDTELRGFLSEYCISLSLSAHPCIVGALGIAFQTDHHYVFAQEIALSKDLLSILHPQVQSTPESFFTWHLCLGMGSSGWIWRLPLL